MYHLAIKQKETARWKDIYRKANIIQPPPPDCTVKLKNATTKNQQKAWRTVHHSSSAG